MMMVMKWIWLLMMMLFADPILCVIELDIRIVEASAEKELLSVEVLSPVPQPSNATILLSVNGVAAWKSSWKPYPVDPLMIHGSTDAMVERMLLQIVPNTWMIEESNVIVATIGEDPIVEATAMGQALFTMNVTIAREAAEKINANATDDDNNNNNKKKTPDFFEMIGGTVKTVLKLEGDVAQELRMAATLPTMSERTVFGFNARLTSPLRVEPEDRLVLLLNEEVAYDGPWKSWLHQHEFNTAFVEWCGIEHVRLIKMNERLLTNASGDSRTELMRLRKQLVEHVPRTLEECHGFAKKAPELNEELLGFQKRESDNSEDGNNNDLQQKDLPIGHSSDAQDSLSRTGIVHLPDVVLGENKLISVLLDGDFSSIMAWGYVAFETERTSDGALNPKMGSFIVSGSKPVIDPNAKKPQSKGSQSERHEYNATVVFHAANASYPIECSLFIHSPSLFEFVEGPTLCSIYHVAGSSASLQSLAVVTAVRSEDLSLFAPSLLNHLCFAKHQNHSYYIAIVNHSLLEGRSVYHIKNVAMRAALEKHQVVMWIDSDAYFNIPAVFAESPLSYFEDEEINTTTTNNNNNVNVVLCGYRDYINTATMIMRQSEWTNALLQLQWEDSNGYFLAHPGDQTAMEHVILKMLANEKHIMYEDECKCTGIVPKGEGYSACFGLPYGYGCFRLMSDSQNITDWTQTRFPNLRIRHSCSTWFEPKQGVGCHLSNEKRRCLMDDYDPAFVVHTSSLHYAKRRKEIENTLAQAQCQF